MFRSYTKQCDNPWAHDLHWDQKGFLWTDEYFCPGVSSVPKSTWEKANPRLGRKVDRQIAAETELCEEPKPHKHFFRLTKSIKAEYMPVYTQYVGAFRLGWQCECGVYIVRERLDMKIELMQAWWNGADQTWPG